MAQPTGSPTDHGTLRFFTGTLTDQTVDSFYLTEQLMAFPEIKKQVTKQVCEEKNFTLLNLVFGYGRDISESDMTRDKMFIANRNIQWTVMTRLRELVHFFEAPSSGQGSGDSGIDIKLSEDWLTVGMVLMVQDGNGGWQNIIITEKGAKDSGFTPYTAKLVTNDASLEFDVSFIDAGYAIGWSYSIDAACSADATLTPFKSLDWYKNWTTIVKQYRQVCRDGIQQVLWVEGQDGTRCYMPMEEYQKFYQFLASIEYAGWYGTSTYDDSGNIVKTDALGQGLGAGDGVLPQIASGNIAEWVISDYDQPSEWESFRAFLNATIVDWAIQNGYDDGNMDLHAYCGLKAYAFLQDVLQNYLEQAGGCCFMDYDSGQMVEAGIIVSSYKFAGFRIVLHKVATFNNPGVNGAFYNTTTPAVSSAPLESYRFLVMPDVDCEGAPLIQCYFRGGCGIMTAYTHKYIPGMVDPTDPGSSRAANKYDGYEVVDETEFVFIVTDPSKILIFKPLTVQPST